MARPDTEATTARPVAAWFRMTELGAERDITE